MGLKLFWSWHHPGLLKDDLVSDIEYVEQVVQQDTHDAGLLPLIPKLRFLQSWARQTWEKMGFLDPAC